jgi:hypothetical protein
VQTFAVHENGYLTSCSQITAAYRTRAAGMSLPITGATVAPDRKSTISCQSRRAGSLSIQWFTVSAGELVLGAARSLQVVRGDRPTRAPDETNPADRYRSPARIHAW